jgi:hypothetical protein
VSKKRPRLGGAKIGMEPRTLSTSVHAICAVTTTSIVAGVERVRATEAADTRDRRLTLTEGHEVAVRAATAATVLGTPTVGIGLRRSANHAAKQNATHKSCAAHLFVLVRSPFLRG